MNPKINNQGCLTTAQPASKTVTGSEAALLLHCIDTNVTLGSVVIPANAFEGLQRHAKESGLTFDELLQSAMAALVNGNAPGEHKKGFFQVNLSAAEQKQMREHCRELDVELRVILRNAVLSAKSKLAEQVKVKRLTGWNCLTQFTKMADNPQRN